MERMRKSEMEIAGRRCHVYEADRAKTLLVQPVDEHDLEVLDDEVRAMLSATVEPFALVAFEVGDWQRDLTPWTAPPAFGKVSFGDGAAQTLAFITGELLPALAAQGLSDERGMRCFLGGYSLAGLFVLWAGYNTTCFAGVAAASPSVWYQGWADYARTHQPTVEAIYLSLGDKEEQTRNARIAQVGTCIRQQHELLVEKGVRTTLEWNEGNHFQQSHSRTAKAFVWLMGE